MAKATIGLYWWGHGRIWFMSMEKMEVITEGMAKRFFAEVEKHQENKGRAFWPFQMTRLQTLRKFICRGGMDSLTAGREREEIPFSFAACYNGITRKGKEGKHDVCKDELEGSKGKVR